jgi:pimeloyl-ACP methyl ester carboxylesterase
MPTVDRAGRTIHFTREGDGPGIVLVPGLGSGARLFGTLPRRFARAGFTCAAVDPVGLPPSAPLPDGVFDFVAAARDVLAVAAELPPPVALVGTSLGGKVALVAAAEGSPHCQRLVMLCSSALQSPRGVRVYRFFELLCAKVAVPTLCLAGAEDTLTLPGEVAATAARIPGAQHACLPQAGHSLLLESAAAFEQVVDFLRAPA